MYFFKSPMKNAEALMRALLAELFHVEFPCIVALHNLQYARHLGKRAAMHGQ